MKKEELIKLIKTNDEWAIASLLKIHSKKNSGRTINNGFTLIDEKLMSDIVKQILNKKSLSKKQIAYIKRSMPKYINQLMKEKFAPNKPNKPNKPNEFKIFGLKKELYAYQKTGVSFIENKDGRALIGDDMGLGKTAQALAYLQKHLELRPALIIVPASLKLNWKKEINKWMSDSLENTNVQICSGASTKIIDIPLHGDIVIINYDILLKQEKRILSHNFKAVILDECHYCKNSKAKRTKSVIKICKKIDKVIALSGTPIVNRPIEFFNIIKIIDPKLFPSRWKFAHRYCGAKNNGWGWDFTGATNTQELHEILTKTIMIRRKKEDVLKELPAKTKTVISLEIDNSKKYKSAEKDIIKWIKENEGEEEAKKAKKAKSLVAFEKLKQLAVDGKMKQSIRWINDFVESDQKLIVFCSHKKVIDSLMDNFSHIAVKIDGSTPSRIRQKAVDDFQNDPWVKLFIGNIKAAGVGITLTASSNVCFLEFPWAPGELEQAEDRVHRIGQKSNSVNIWYLVASNTIEEDIADIISKKQKVLSNILEGKAVSEGTVLSDLIDQMKNKELFR